MLPPGSVPDEHRWVSHWPMVEQAQAAAAREALEALGLETGADWSRVVEFVCRRFADHWTAGVAFHS